jgi:secreted trypsin-like serine protease
MKKFLLCFILLLISSNVISGTIDPSVSDTKYIEYGNKFNYVGKLCGVGGDNQQYCASAVAINDRFILTAAHIIKDAKSCTITINNKTIKVINIEYPIEFEPNNFGFNDIAIGYCEDTIDLEFYPELYENNDEVNKICSISGYGLTGTFITGATTSDNNRRAGSNIIDEIQNDLLICSPSGPGKKTSLEFIIASGDSGGGLFIDNKLAGINSCVMAADKKPDSTYTDECGHTRISKFVSWIKERKTKIMEKHNVK